MPERFFPDEPLISIDSLSDPAFIDYDDMPFVISSEGFFHMVPSKEDKRGYMLEEDMSSRCADALYNGYHVTEADAVELL